MGIRGAYLVSNVGGVLCRRGDRPSVPSTQAGVDI